MYMNTIVSLQHNRDCYLRPFEMQTQVSAARFFCCLLLIAIVKTMIACAEPESMARPTRPKVITSPEELNKYLALVQEYYSLTGRTR